MKITIADYGIGNLFSIRKGLERAGADVEIADNMSALASAECLVFPGVGAFGEAMRKLGPVRKELVESLRDGTPALGICLGMQLLFDSSEESPEDGLGFVAGKVVRLGGPRIPQMGWNDVSFSKGEPLFEGVKSGTQFYYANSYVCAPSARGRGNCATIARSVYGRGEFAAAVSKSNAYGVQFHPEKSGDAGLRVLRNFVEIAGGK